MGIMAKMTIIVAACFLIYFLIEKFDKKGKIDGFINKIFPSNNK